MIYFQQMVIFFITLFLLTVDLADVSMWSHECFEKCQRQFFPSLVLYDYISNKSNACNMSMRTGHYILTHLPRLE